MVFIPLFVVLFALSSSSVVQAMDVEREQEVAAQFLKLDAEHDQLKNKVDESDADREARARMEAERTAAFEEYCKVSGLNEEEAIARLQELKNKPADLEGEKDKTAEKGEEKPVPAEGEDKDKGVEKKEEAGEGKKEELKKEEPTKEESKKEGKTSKKKTKTIVKEKTTEKGESYFTATNVAIGAGVIGVTYAYYKGITPRIAVAKVRSLFDRLKRNVMGEQSYHLHREQ